jgi:hypothetical protein
LIMVEEVSENQTKVVFQILEADVQEVARHKVRRLLTEDELYSVKKGVEGGLCFWEQVVTSAIEETLEP